MKKSRKQRPQAKNRKVRRKQKAYRGPVHAAGQTLAAGAGSPLLDLALQHHMAGRLEDADTLYRQVLENDPSQTVALHLHGVIAHQQGRNAEAVETISRALALEPDYVEAHSNLGLALQALGRLDEARSSFTCAIELNPQHFEAYNNLGNLFKVEGDMENARDSYEKAIGLKPDYEISHYNLGTVHEQMGQEDLAKASYEKAVTLRPEYTKALTSLSNILSRSDKLEEAVASYQKVIVLQPGYATAHNNLAVALQQLGRLDEARQSVEQALKLNPNYLDAQSNLGSILLRLNLPEQAEACFRRLLAGDPSQANTHYLLGHALKQQEKVAEAVDSFDAAVSLNPNFPQARYLLDFLKGNQPPSAPREYVEELFDSYASTFEQKLAQALDYNAPANLKAALKDTGLLKGKVANAVDLGCGTGLAGVQFRDLTQNLTGIDVSAKMIAEARSKNIYDDLIIDDIVSGLSSLDQPVDLFLATDVFIYVGDLEAVFAAIKGRAAAGALLAFSTESHDGEGYHLRPTGRYAHSADYIRAVADRVGFKVKRLTPTNLRKEADDWIKGDLYVLSC